MKKREAGKLQNFRFRSAHTGAARGGPGGARLLLLGFLLGALAVAQTPPSRRQAVHEHLQKAEAYLRAKDPDSAVKELHAVLQLDPKNAAAYANLGGIAFFQGDYSSAAPELRKALTIDPKLTQTQALLGMCEKRLGDASARGLLEKSFANLKDTPLRLQVGMELADLYDQQDEPGATACVMRSLVNLAPDNVDVLFTAQRTYSELADDTLNKLAVLAPGSGRMQQVIAERLINGGDLKGAIEHYQKALQISPRLAGVRFELGEAILQSAPNDTAAQAAAQKEFETAAAVDGDSAQIESELGRIAWAQSDMDGALAHYEHAYRLNPNEVEAELGLARLLMRQQKPKQAIPYLQAAIASDPLNSEAHYRLALAYRQLQMEDEAHKEMHLFQEIKKTKDQVKALYREMNIQPRTQHEDMQDQDE